MELSGTFFKHKYLLYYIRKVFSYRKSSRVVYTRARSHRSMNFLRLMRSLGWNRKKKWKKNCKVSTSSDASLAHEMREIVCEKSQKQASIQLELVAVGQFQIHEILLFLFFSFFPQRAPNQAFHLRLLRIPRLHIEAHTGCDDGRRKPSSRNIIISRARPQKKNCAFTQAHIFVSCVRKILFQFEFQCQWRLSLYQTGSKV